MKFITIDVETTGIDWTACRLHGVSIGVHDTTKNYSPNAQYYMFDEIPAFVRTLLEDPTIAKLGHNLRFDAKVLRKAGFEINGPFDDTMVLYNLINDTTPLGLKFLAERYLGEDSLESKRELDKYVKLHNAGHIGELCALELADYKRPHRSVIAKYCVEDNENTTKLFLAGIERLKEIDTAIKGPKFNFKKSPMDYYLEEARPLERVLFDMEYRGIRVDLSVFSNLKQQAELRMLELEGKLFWLLNKELRAVEQFLQETERLKVSSDVAKLKRIAGQGKCKFSWGNNNHIGMLIYEHCGLSSELISTTKKGKYKTDKLSLQDLLIEVPVDHVLRECLPIIAEYKLHTKIATTYTGDNKKGILSQVRYIDGTPRIFPSYRQTTGTGRLACTRPNMQNLKSNSEIKKAFIPDEGEIFDDVDYSQIELRTGAHLSKDPGLVNAYINEEDVHLRTASRLFKKTITKDDIAERQAGKRTNFLTIFDGGAYRLMESLKQETKKDFALEECKEFIRIWFDEYPRVREYLNEQLEFFKKHKFCISETGRIRRLPDIVFGNIQWNRKENTWTPIFKGSTGQKNELLHSLCAKHKCPAYDITESMIGWEASKRYKHAIKAGYNQPIQGLAASLTKRSMIALHQQGKKLMNQVHDSLVIARIVADTSGTEQVVSTMENIYKLSVPVKVDVKTIRSFHPNDK
jgi:DNA polymerase I